MNQQLEEYDHANHKDIAHNTRRKMRATEDTIPSTSNQVSTSNVTYHVTMMYTQSSAAPQQRRDTGNKSSTKLQIAQM